MTDDPALHDHQQWLGYLQPVGLVVSPPALLAAQAYLNRNIIPEHRRFLDWVQEVPLSDGLTTLAVTDWPGLLVDVFGWRSGDLLGAPGAEPLPDTLEVALPEYHETLRPTYAVREIDPSPGASEWLLLMQTLPPGTPLDKPATLPDTAWPASPQARGERLLRETQVPIGLLSNGAELRLMYAPRGETSGYLTFRVADMARPDCRVMFAALHLLLSQERLFSLPAEQRLPAILAASRKYQNQVSTQLAEQVLAALYALLRGFQAADAQAHGALLGELTRREPNQVYAGLLTMLLRLIFILYAEDRGLLSTAPVYVNYYSLSGLFERLRADVGRYPDTMDQRYGAWPQLLTLFRLIHDGGRHGDFHLPTRRGSLFDPDAYPFLEGRRQTEDRIQPPRVADGVIYRVLASLLILNGERLSYRSLDVEHIGSVYEAMMGFTLDVATGPTIAAKAPKSGGAPVMLNLDALLAQPAERRGPWLAEQTDQTLTGPALTALASAATPEAAVAALGNKVAREATPDIAPPGSLLLQPTEERRRTGSHYTPPELTRPMVREALRPVLAALGANPAPAQILNLNVCDLAMGSGAFLVETCRQLAEALMASWRAHQQSPALPPDEDELLHARRWVAQRCLYGVDVNPLAVELAKLSLWLVTLARDHPFTFLDHALRGGDSLLGIRDVKDLDWFYVDPASGQRRLTREQNWLDQASARRRALELLPENDSADIERKQALLGEVEALMWQLRLLADVVTGAQLRFSKPAALKKHLQAAALTDSGGLQRQAAEHLEGRRPFHWPLEFPDIMEQGGFDAIVGNPPFLGGKRITGVLGTAYRDYLLIQLAGGKKGHADLCAYFFLRAGELVRQNGMITLLATNTIAQGDTREVGLEQLVARGFTISRAVASQPWPGEASLEVAQVWLMRGSWDGEYMLDNQPVAGITPFLTPPGNVQGKPFRLAANANKSFQGSIVLGMGFVLTPKDAAALIAKDPRNKDALFPYLNGEDLNSRPNQSPSRWVINFHDWPLERSADGCWETANGKQRKEWLKQGRVPGDYPDSVAADYPDLLAIVEETVKPERTRKKPDGSFALRYPLYLKWWIYADKRPALYATIAGMERVLVKTQVSKHHMFMFVPKGQIFDQRLVCTALSGKGSFLLMQSSIHEEWGRHYGSTLETRYTYTPSDCFETFPFPKSTANLEDIGERYYTHRQGIMQTRQEGLTKTYNRFHNPHETAPDIVRLRELHVEMDHAVAAAYGWQDLLPSPSGRGAGGEGLGHGFHDTKQGRRYTISETARREVLDRLLALNHARHEAEELAGKAKASSGKHPKTHA